MGENYKKQMSKRLNEVTLMRCILAVLVVFMHSFTIWQGSWEPFEGYIDIPLYKWIARLAYAFSLPAFVFVSGYLMSFKGARGGVVKA